MSDLTHPAIPFEVSHDMFILVVSFETESSYHECYRITSREFGQVASCWNELDARLVMVRWWRQMYRHIHGNDPAPGATSLSYHEWAERSRLGRERAAIARAKKQALSEREITNRTHLVFGAVNEGLDQAAEKTPEQIQSDINDLFN